MQEVIARWDGFLGKIRQRFDQIMEESRQGCAMLLQASDLDTMAMTNAWGAMEMRAKDLESKIHDVWNEQVEGAFDDADAPGDVVDRERDKGYALSRAFERERERTRIQILCDAARKIWARAREEQQGTFNCSQCGGQLEIPHTFRAVNVTCPYCSAVVTFEPGARTRSLEWFCVHPLCEEAGWELWIAMQDAEQAYKDRRNPTIDDIKRWEHAQITYWRAYLQHQATLMPEKAAALEADLRGKMRQWYDNMHNEGPWIRAGRPRELPFS